MSTQLKSHSAASSVKGKVPVISAHSAHQQRGIVLLIALVMLIAMTLVGVSMLRAVGSGTGIAGNLAFKQNATSVADLGVEIARTWLFTKSSVQLQADSSAEGYYSTWVDGFNPLTYDWSTSKKLSNTDAAFISATTGKDTTGNEIRYVVHRLCANTGAVDNYPTQKCANFTDYGALGSKGGGGYGQKTPALSEQPYFRVTVRASGPRNTVSYVQVVMY